jgi:hypothetical protein
LIDDQSLEMPLGGARQHRLSVRDLAQLDLIAASGSTERGNGPLIQTLRGEPATERMPSPTCPRASCGRGRCLLVG